MSWIFTRITDDEVLDDAVAVSIGGESEDELTVSIMWPGKGSVPADEEEGGTVPLALREAEVIRERLGFARVVVLIENVELWQPQWGVLIDPKAGRSA